MLRSLQRGRCQVAFSTNEFKKESAALKRVTESREMKSVRHDSGYDFNGDVLDIKWVIAPITASVK